MPVEKKRPRGLKNSAASKKTKIDEPTNVADLPESTQTVVIEKEVEEGDEVGEAAALFESAIEKLETDPANALALLRGTIHESDRILRNYDSKEPLPALFYYTYGSALYELGRLTEDEEFGPYLDAAEERLNDSLELKDTTLANKIHLALAKIWLAKASGAVSKGEQTIPELATKAIDSLDKALTESDISIKSIIELADIVHNHGELYESLELRDKFRLWAESTLEKVLKDEPSNANALSTLGLCKLSFANYLLDSIDDDGDDEKKELSEAEEKAYQAILDSKKYFELAKNELAKTDQISPQILSDLAEIYLNEANLVLKEEEQAEIYKKAVSCINEANKLIETKQIDFILPEGLTIFLEEYN